MKNTKNRTRILSILAIVFCLVMALGITAFAAENDVEPAANTYVAEWNGTEYTTLQAAINACTAVDKPITLIGNVNENVTVSKNLTIDGAGKNYTGKMSVGTGLNVVIQNVNFVNSQIQKDTKSSAGTYTIENCNFDGTNGTFVYPLSFHGANKVTVKDCTAKNYSSFLYVRSSAISVSITNVDVECPSYAVYFASGVNNATFDNLTVKNSEYGIVLNDSANRAFTITNSTMENVDAPIFGTSGANTISCAASGVNDFGVGSNSQNVKISAEAQNGTKFGELESIAADAKAGETVKILKETNEIIALPEGVKLDKNGFNAEGVTETKNAIEVSTKAELDAAIAAANDGDVIKLANDLTYDGSRINIDKAITLDLNGKTITTNGSFGAIKADGGCSIVNGEIVYTGTNAVIKVWNAKTIEDLVIEATNTSGATIGGIVIQEGSTVRVDSIKNVTITGAGLTNGIQTYNCGTAKENVIGSMENVNIDAVGVAMNIYAPCGTATNCTFKGDNYGIEIWIKGTYNATLDLVNCTVVGGGAYDVFAHDEFKEGVTNNGTLTLTADAATGLDNSRVNKVLLHESNIEVENEGAAQATTFRLFYTNFVETTNYAAQIGETKYATLEEAFAAAQNGETVTLIADSYEDIVIPAEFGGTLAIGTCTINSITNNSATAKIVITGDVVVENSNGSAITGEVINISGNGTLTAIANGDHAYGIGGDNTKSITIENVHILNVKGGHYGEIGTDTKYYKNAPEGGAAIGSGSNGAVITLTNVKIDKALGGSKAAGIGALYHTGVTINITGCEIAYVEGGVTAAGIGGSRVSSGATAAENVYINIKGSTITAVGGVYAAGIGSGYDTHCQANQPICTIKIDGSTINATGGQYAAGIGTGYHNAGLDGEIKNSTITAASGDKVYKDKYTAAQDIGFGVADLAREGSNNDSSITYNGTKISLPNYVVQIGETKYNTLAEALEAANAGDTITFVADVKENVTVNKAVTIDGAGFKYIGKMTIAGVVDSVDTVKFVNVKFLADTTVGNNVVVDLQRYAEATFDGCDFTSNSTDTYYNSYKGIIVANDCTVEIKNSTASKLYYMVHVSQGSTSLVVENCTLTDMVYGVGAFKTTNVTVKDFTYKGMAAGINVKNSGASTLALENVNITTTMNGQAPVAMWAPDSGVAAVKYTITLKGENVANGVAMTVANEADWFIRQDETNPYEIKNLNGLNGSGTQADPYQIGSVEDLIMFRDSVNAGEGKYNNAYVKLVADIDLAGLNWTPVGTVAYNNKYVPVDTTKVFSGVFDGNGKVIYNLTMTKMMNAGADAEANLGLFGITGEGAVIKNVTLTNVTITTDGRNVGALVGFAYKATLDNITVNGNIQIKGGNNVAGVCAMTRYYAMSATNITVNGAAGSVIEGNNIVGGIFAEIAPNGSAQTFKNLSVENVAISGKGGVGGIVGLLTLGTVENVTVKNVTITANTLYSGNAMGRIRMGSVAGLMGGAYATIANATVEKVTAKNLDGNAVVLPIIGANYDASSNATEAKIGDKYYATFAKAYAAANEGETITLLAPIVVAEGETLTLDKNVTITYTSSVVGEDMFTVRGTLNISAGTITYVNTDTTGNNVTVSTISAEPGSVVNVTGGTVENKTVYSTGSYAYAIDLLTNGNLGDVTVTISGGKVYSDYMAIRQFNNGTACKNTLTVTGGEIYGAKRAIQIHINNDAAYLAISGGKIKAGEGGYALCLFPETATHIAVTGGNFVGEIYSGTNAFVSGGTFTKMYAAYVAEGFTLNENKDGSYGVVKTTVTIGSVEDLLAFADAVTGNTEYQGVKVAANAKAVVLLTSDLDLAGSGFAPIGNGAANAFSGTFDGQGHTISNMTLSCDYYRGVGFFRSLGNGAVVKNVTFVNANVNNGAGTGANHFYGVVAGFSANLTLDNVTVKDSTVTCKYSGAVMVGCLQNATTIKNSTVENVTLKTNDIRAAVYGIIGNSATGHTITVENNKVEDVELNIKGEIKELPETVGYGSWNAGNDYAETTYVAQIGDKKYSTLIDAIKAATAGDTITLIGDVELAGSITIDKNLTIDGNGNTITGTMTLNDDLTVTVQNFNFVNGGIAKATKSTKGNYTIKGCTFNGAGKYAYALSFKGANKVTVEDCTVSNYKFGFLYVSSGTNNVSVKDVTVDKCSNYAVYFGSGVNTATFENFTVKNSNNGFILNNTANRYFTIKNCTMENVGTAINYSKGTNTITCTVLGVNDFGTAALSQYANLLAAAKIDNVYYETFAAALEAAKAGDIITLLADLTMSEILVIDKAITLDGNGKTLTSTAGRAINVSGADGVTIKNLTINCSGERAINVIQNATNVTIDNVTATAANYTVNIASSAPNAVVAIKNSTLNGLCTVNVASAGAEVTIDNSTINCNDNNTTVGESYAAVGLVKEAVGAKIIVTNSEINVAAGSDSVKARNGAVDGVITIDGKTDEVSTIVAIITYAGSNNYHGFYTLASAIEFAKAGDTITLLRDVTSSAIITINKAITLDGNGNTLTSTATRAINVETEGKVVISNLTINAGERAVNIINKAATVELNKVTATAANNAVMIATSAGAVKLTVNDSNLTGLAVVNVAGAGSVVAINNTIITNVDANEGENYGAITVWTSAEKATVTVDGGEITVADDSKKAYVFPGDATVNGVDEVGCIVAIVGDAGFDTLAGAFEYATAGDTITLVRDVTSSAIITINKAITLDGNGKTLTSTAGRAINVSGANGVTIKNLTINCSGERAINVIQNATNVTIDNVTATADNYTVNVASSAANAVVTIKNSNLTGLNVVNVAAKNANVTVANTTLNCADNTDAESYAALFINTDAANATITATAVEFVIGGDSVKAIVASMGGSITIDGKIDDVTMPVAYISYGANAYVFFTLADAIEKAQAGDTITLLRDVTLAEIVKIEKAITIDLNGNTVTSTAKKAFEVYANVTIKNGTIVGANRCVDTRTAVELTLTDVTLTADKYTAYGNPQPLTIGGSTNGTKVTMNNVTINAGTSGYGIITFVKTELAATNCTINGYSVLYVQAGSEGSEFNFANSNLTATTGNNDVAGNAFAAFAFDASDVTVNVNGGSVTAIGNYSYIFAPKTADKLNVTIDAATVTGNMIVGDAYVVVNNNGVITLAKTVAEVNGTKYATLAEAIAAAQTGDVVKLLSDVTVAATNGGYSKAGVIISGEILDGNGHTLTVTGAGATWDCGIYITAGTVKNITVKGSFRGIFTAGASADIYLDNVNFKNVVYTFNSDGGNTQYGVYISNSTINGWTSFSNVHKEVVFNNCSFGNGSGYAFCRPYNTTVFNGCTFSEDYEIDGSQAQMTFQNMAAESVYALVDGAAAIVARGKDVVTYTTLVEAWAAAQDGDIIVLVKDITISEGITNTKKITLDLNGYTITGTDTATGSFGLITNKGELTITGNGTMTLVAPNNNRGWNAYSSVISNTVGGKLVVVNGTIEHLGGTDMAYAIDNLTNGKGTYAETVINGGTIKSTYRAIRMFLNGTEAQNILTVNGGVIEGANKSIWMQDPSKNANTGSLTVKKGATLNGDVYLTVTEGSTEWPVEVSIAATAVNGEVLTNGNAPERYVLEKKSGNWVVNEYIAKVSNGVSTSYYADLQTALNKTPKYYTVYLLDNYSGDALVVGTNNKATTDGMGINLNGFAINANITVASPSNKFTFTLSNGTMNGNIVANDGLTLTDVTVNGNIEVNSACTIKADAAVTGTINVVGNGVLTVKDGAMINGVAFSTEAYLSGKVTGINVAYYVLNYNKNVYSFYANKADADALAAKYRGYKTYAV